MKACNIRLILNSILTLNSGSIKGKLTPNNILSLPSTPLCAPSYPKGPYTFFNREYFIVEYESDAESINKVLPYPLKPQPGNRVLYEWINMPDSTGFGSYSESGTVIPALLDGRPVGYVAQMYLDDEPPIAGGREIWGFPKKYAEPKLQVRKDTLCGTLVYNQHHVATGTMAYKYQPIAPEAALRSLSGTQVNLKILPGQPWCSPIKQLVGYRLQPLRLHFAWSGPARLQLFDHINAPVSALPIKKIIGGRHLMADIVLPYGEVMYNYENEVKMNSGQVLSSYVMPAMAPSYNQGPYMLDIESFTSFFKTDLNCLLEKIPEQLSPNADGICLAEWAKVSGQGIGDYDRLMLSVPCQDSNGKWYRYVLQCYSDSSSAITTGREVFGLPYKVGKPVLDVRYDTVNGTFEYAGLEVAKATMSYKYSKLDDEVAKDIMNIPYATLRFIPDVDGQPLISQLVAVTGSPKDVSMAYYGPSQIYSLSHVNAPLADFPVQHSMGGVHIKATIQHQSDHLLHDYIKK